MATSGLTFGVTSIDSAKDRLILALNMEEATGAARQNISRIGPRGPWDEVGGPISRVSGKDGFGIDFEKDSSQHLDPATPSVDVIAEGRDRITAIGWYNPESLTGGAAVSLYVEHDSSVVVRFQLQIRHTDITSPGHLEFRVKDNVGPTLSFISSSALVSSTGSFQFYAARFDRVAGNVTMQRNDSRETFVTGIGALDNTTPSALGVRIGNIADGIADAFYVWDTALSNDQLDDLYNAGAGRFARVQGAGRTQIAGIL